MAPPRRAQTVAHGDAAAAPASFPSIVLVGPREDTTHVQRALEEIRVLVEPVDDVEAALHRVGRSTFGIVLFANDAHVDEVARLRSSDLAESIPLFVVMPERCSDKRARMLYRAGATVVFAWPSEVLLVPKVIGELIDATAQGDTPKWSDAALAASVTARLELAEGIGRGVTVKVVDGVAHVGGVVDSPWKRRRVLRILAQVPGLQSVDADDLRVCEPAPAG
ncbi:MAG TPA: BON domain-containing protein [Nannocystaceae bacterium]|nr:BON domain-containing protein [Nannocystaceae bacterium]